MSNQQTLRILIVDDEAPARVRLRTLLDDLVTTPGGVALQVVGEAEDGVTALIRLAETPADLVLTDIRMPRMDGIELAEHLGSLPAPPAVIFITAYDNYAVQAFELNALDYLLKPVRAQRLAAALGRLAPPSPSQLAAVSALGQQVRGGGRTHLSSQERGRLLLVPVADILYFKADLKYVTARTVEREYLLDEALTHLEQEYPERFLRLHRAVLVARNALAGFERAASENEDAYGWALLRGVSDKLPVSRRQWTLAKDTAKNA